ncbi:MAG: restriction endonuclease subunit S, partial [Muribaculaceae bacterium]|nr:restriction endonuclease subunit S [Muribaculaceae bacterium]
MKTGVINCKAFFDAGMRIDPDVHLSEGSVIRNELNHLPYQLSTVGENAADVFYGNIFSRIFVQDPEHGMPYLAASDTVLANLDTGRFLSKKQSAQLNYLILKKDWILVTCSGTLGNVTYTNKTFENHIATHDLIRIIPNSNKVNKGTLYAFLASKFGYYQITQSQFGGVVKHINTDQTKSIIVPVFPADFQQDVDNMIQESARLRERASELLVSANELLMTYTGLSKLSPEDYDYFGPSSASRKVSTFYRNISEIGSLSFNAFNHSERIRTNLLSRLSNLKTIPLFEAIESGVM